MTTNYKNFDEETYQGMIKYYDNMPLGVCIFEYMEMSGGTFDFRAVYVNDPFENTVHCPKTLLMKTTLREIMHQRPELDRYFNMLRYVAIANTPYQDEIYDTNVKKYLKLQCTQYKPGYVMIFLWDITEEKKEAIEVETTNEALLDKIEIIDALSNIYYAQYRIDLTTGQAVEITSVEKVQRYIPKEGDAQYYLNVMCDKLIVADYNDEMRRFVDLSTLKERMKDKNIVSHEFIGIESGWSRANFVGAKRDENNDVVQVLFVTQHIDEEKKQELDYQRKLEEALETARQANRTRTRFLSSMSHDIRTPINGILGMIDMDCSEKVEKAKHHEHMEKIRASAEQLLSILNDVLEMSKLENGISCLTEEAFDLIQLVEAVKCYDNPLQVRFVIDTKKVIHSRVLGSPAHVRQVLFHTVGNAIKYNRENGTVHIEVSEKILTEKRSSFQIMITDTGLGMSEEFVEHIFEPFTQEHGDARTTFEGTGLGMSIAKRLVEEMGGAISVESKLHVGSSVCICLPLLISDTNVRNAEEPEKEEEADVAGMRALLVEDNEINSEITQFILESANIEVTAVQNGQLAVDTFENSADGEFDMILMDIMMPVMDGLEATREIRALDRRDAKRVPIIAVTANTFPEDVKKSYEAGMDDHIGKPINRENLLGAIKKYTKRNSKH